MLRVEYVCLIGVKGISRMFSKLTKLHWNSQCKHLNAIHKHHGEKKKSTLSSNFELRSEFREASHESLVLTGTPSVCNLKFRMRLHCAGNPSHCKRLRVLRRLSAFTCLSWNSQCNGSKHYLMNAMLTRDCRECSRYSRSSAGAPKLKLSNTFIDALTYAGDSLIVIANFENVLKICYNDARLR